MENAVRSTSLTAACNEGGNQRQSVAIRSNQWGAPRSRPRAMRDAIRGNQRQSVAISGEHLAHGRVRVAQELGLGHTNGEVLVRDERREGQPNRIPNDHRHAASSDCVQKTSTRVGLIPARQHTKVRAEHPLGVQVRVVRHPHVLPSERGARRRAELGPAARELDVHCRALA